MSKKKRSGVNAPIQDNHFTVLVVERYISDPKHQKEIGFVGNKLIDIDVIQLTLSYKDEKIKVILDHSLNNFVQTNKIQAGSVISLTDFKVQTNETSHNGADILIVKDIKVIKKDPKDTDEVQIVDDDQDVQSDKASKADSMETHTAGDNLDLEELSDSDCDSDVLLEVKSLSQSESVSEDLRYSALKGKGKGEKVPQLPRAPEGFSDSDTPLRGKVKKIRQSPKRPGDTSGSSLKDTGKGKKTLQSPRAPEPVAGPSWMPDTPPLRLNQEPIVLDKDTDEDTDDDALQDLTEIERLVQLQKENPVEGPITSSRSYFNSVWSSVEVVGEAWKINKPVRENLGNLHGNIMNLGDLSLDMRRNPMVCVKVLLKLRLFLYPKPDRNDKWPMQAKILVGDGSGICTVVLWNRMAAEWYYSISVGDVLLLRHFTRRGLYRPLEREKLVKAVGNKHLMDMELSVNHSCPPAEVIKVRPGSIPDNLALPPVLYNLVSRKQVGTMHDNTIVDVAGVVFYVGRYEREPMKRFSHDSGAFWVRQWIQLKDGTTSLPFVVQIYHASIGLTPVDIKPGNLLLCTNVRVVIVLNKKEGPHQKKLTFLTSTEETEVKVLDEDAFSMLTTQTRIRALVHWSKLRQCTEELENAGVGGYTPGLELASCADDVLAEVKDIPPIPSESWFELFDSLKYREVRQVSIYASLVSVLYHPRKMEADNDNTESRPILMAIDDTVTVGMDDLPIFGKVHVSDVFPMRFSSDSWPSIKKRLDFPSMELKEEDDEQAEGYVDLMARPYLTFLWKGLNDNKMFYSHHLYSHRILKECSVEDIMSGELAFNDEGAEASYEDMKTILETAEELFGVKCHVILNLYQTSTDNTEMVLKRAFKKGQHPIQRTPDQKTQKEADSEPKCRKLTPADKPSPRLCYTSESHLERQKSNASRPKQPCSLLQRFSKTSPRISSPTQGEHCSSSKVQPNTRMCKTSDSKLEHQKSKTSQSKHQIYLQTSPKTSHSSTQGESCGLNKRKPSSRSCKTSGSSFDRQKSKTSQSLQHNSLHRILQTSPNSSSPTQGKRCKTNKVLPMCTKTPHPPVPTKEERCNQKKTERPSRSCMTSRSRVERPKSNAPRSNHITSVLQPFIKTSPTKGKSCNRSLVEPPRTPTSSSPCLEYCGPMKDVRCNPRPSCSTSVESHRSSGTELKQTHSYTLIHSAESRFLSPRFELPVLPVIEFYEAKLKGIRRTEPFKIYGPLRRSSRLKDVKKVVENTERVVQKVVENTEDDAVMVSDSDSSMED